MSLGKDQGRRFNRASPLPGSQDGSPVAKGVLRGQGPASPSLGFSGWTRQGVQRTETTESPNFDRILTKKSMSPTKRLGI